MNEELYMSSELSKLAPALVKVQSEIKPVGKGKENPFFHSKYADLVSVVESCRKLLTDNGFSVIQTGVQKGDKFFMRTTLLHSSGQWIAGEYLLNPAKNDPQCLASCWTYSRRYSLMGIVGIVAQDEDDDANAASNTTTVKTNEAPKTNGHKTAIVATAENGYQKIAFVPRSVSMNAGTKNNGETYKRYSVKSPDGKWFSTFDEVLGALLNKAKDSQSEVELLYAIEGDFLNIKDVHQPVPF